MDEIVSCIPCRRKQSELLQKLPILRQITKQRAIEKNETMVIWLDKEDAKWQTCTYTSAIERGFTIVEIISKYL